MRFPITFSNSKSEFVAFSNHREPSLQDVYQHRVLRHKGLVLPGPGGRHVGLDSALNQQQPLSLVLVILEPGGVAGQGPAQASSRRRKDSGAAREQKVETRGVGQSGAQAWEGGHVLRGEEQQRPEGPQQPVARAQGGEPRRTDGGLAAGPQDVGQGELELGAVRGQPHGPAATQRPHEAALHHKSLNSFLRQGMEVNKEKFPTRECCKEISCNSFEK